MRAAGQIEFARDVQPILTRYCYECHGPDASARKAALRLDQHDDALGQIEPGDPSSSEFYRRLIASDPDTRMPPAEAEKQPTLKEIATLKRWIEEGAAWERLWSLGPLASVELPAVKETQWVKNPVDHFVLARLEEEGLQPAPPASKHAWLRRVTFDLTGLPPTPEEIDAYFADDSPEADRKVIERLLASPAYGENFARDWLDLARYADTHGYSVDGHRDMWRYRDWVIDALNRNVPFSEFTTLQLAGDLIDQPTIESRTATGFHRNAPINDEMGAIAEEYRHAYLVDRVNTTGTVFLGMTFACAQCHDHKYDPVSQKDFYRLAAFFNSIDEKGLDGKFGNAAPVMKSPTREQQHKLSELERRLHSYTKSIEKTLRESEAQLPAWEREATKNAPPQKIADDYLIEKISFDKLPLDSTIVSLSREEGESMLVGGRNNEALLSDGRSQLRIERPMDRPLSVSVWLYPTIKTTSLLYRWQAADGEQVELLQKGDWFELVHVSSVGEATSWEATSDAWETNQWQHLAWSIDPANPRETELWVRGERLNWSQPKSERQEEMTSDDSVPNRGETILQLRGLVDDLRLDGRRLSDDDVAILEGGNPIEELLAIPAEQRTQQQTERLVRYFARQKLEFFPELERQKQYVQDQLSVFRSQLPETMVMRERDAPRPTHVRIRGEWDRLGEEVSPGVPTQLFAATENYQNVGDRLGLAQWIADPANGLARRVWANRAWQHFFGTGIVKTVEDFGTRGELPSHPNLLAYLAEKFASDGDMKDLHRMIVSSATYRQSSHVGREAYQRDPENRWLARGPRLRLAAEEIRDQALAACGLLVQEIGGRSVKPYQPAGLWEELSIGDEQFSAQRFTQDHGDRLYRRSLYTYWKRSSPPPNMTTLDAPNREICIAQRSRTNTPMQALVLLNDVTFVEAAKVLAADLQKRHGEDNEAAIGEAFLRIVSRPIDADELALLMQLHEQELARFQAEPEAAVELLSLGETSVESSPQLAALTVVCHTILNLDEAIVTP
ncbi:PSD1 and planctomycete cytochrome C domain-containing protein [Blastopirellula marina]|uniref:PSD1 and planctomycete cytochrome C domain-containing protein n=1 Tax=Blastopirellula marina TaxID=124 RepID=UPI001304B60F|nr:PSD1 and planctomycete cytochrome C domain-containing protein [Blastopirellula marina]